MSPASEATARMTRKGSQLVNLQDKSTRSSTRTRSRPPTTVLPRTSRAEVIELSSDNENEAIYAERANKRKRERTPIAAAVERKDGFLAQIRLRKKLEEQLEKDSTIRYDTLKAELEHMSKEVDRYKHELEVSQNKYNDLTRIVKRKHSPGKLDLAELDDAILCEICTMKMYSPATISECGHTFCTNCLFDWFNTTYARHVEAHPEFLQQPDIPENIMHYRNDPRISVQIANLEALWRQRVAQPEYTCPTCRVRAKSQPVHIYAFKDVIHKIARLSGEKDVGKAQWRPEMWDGFFPRK